MRLRGKLIVIIGIAWVLFMSLIFMGTEFYLLKNIKMYEQLEFDKNIERVQKSIDQELQSLSVFTSDWSYWNDAYNYLEGTNPKFVVNNIDLLTFALAHINILIYLDKKGSIVIGVSMDRSSSRFIPYPQGLEKYVYPNSPLEQHKVPIKSTYGLAYVNDSILLLASAGVSNTDVKKPIIGTLVTARYFTQDVLQKISSDVALPLNLYLPNNIKKDVLLSKLINKANNDNNFRKIIILASIKSAHAYLILRDIHQEPVGIIKIYLPRTTYVAGVKAINYYLVTLLLTALLLVFMIWYLLRIFVLDRLEKLTKKIHDINADKDYSSRLKVSAQDEISELSTEFNSMMKTIDLSNKKTLCQIDQLEISQNRLESMNKKLVNEVNERKQAEIKAKKLSDNLILASRKAGMADIANSILNSLGSILNNILTGITSTKQRIQKSQPLYIDETTKMLEKHKDDLKDFLENYPNGDKMLLSMLELTKYIKNDKKCLDTEITNLEKNINRMKEIIKMQEELSSVTDVCEEISLSKIINDLLILNKSMYKKYKIHIDKNIKFDGKILVDTVKLLHILVSVFKCAIESVLSSNIQSRKIIIETEKINEDKFKIIIGENGMGIAIEDINKLLILNELMTEKKYMLGIQASMAFCKDMGGSLTVELGDFGTLFIITLPVITPQKI